MVKRKTPRRRAEDINNTWLDDIEWRRIALYGMGAILFIIVLWGAYLNFQVQGSLAGKLWSIPAKVYARPLELYVGSNLRKDELIQELNRLGYQNSQSLTRPGNYVIQGATVQIYKRYFQFWDGEEPAQKIKVSFSDSGVSGLQASVSKTSLVRLDPLVIGGIYPDNNEDRVLISLKEVPPYFIEGLLAVEDRHFFHHHGISLRGMARAVMVNASEGRFAQGGSTLTQQLIKNMYLSSERKLSRKLTEAYMAVLLEMHYSKRDILQAYLNEVYLGQSGPRAIHGFGLASEFYFGRPFAELRLHQVALLVALIKGPSYYNPYRNPERAKERRDQVLDVLVETGLVTAEQARQAKRQPLGVIHNEEESSNRYPGFMDLVRRQLLQNYREKDLRDEGLRIFTTLDPRVQIAAEKSMVNTMRSLGRNNPLQGALLVTSPDNAEILAMVSDADPRFPGFNRVLDAQRQVGSVIKPAVYLSALSNGYELNSVLKDEPIKMALPSGNVWQPMNFDKAVHGDVLLQDALAHSYNLATAHLGLDLGLRKVIQTLRQLGVTKELQPELSLVLGAVEMSPFEVTSLYQTIAANGFSSSVHAIREVVDNRGKPLAHYPLDVQQKFDATPIYLTQVAMQQVMLRGTGSPAYRELPSSLNLAGKTGTTDDNRDSWFVGMSGNYLAVAWMGRDDNGPTHVTGATGALKLWTQFMKSAHPTPLNLVVPEDVQGIWVDAKTGAFSSQHCQNSEWVMIRKNQVPSEYGPCVEKPASPDTWLDEFLGTDTEQPSAAADTTQPEAVGS